MPKYVAEAIIDVRFEINNSSTSACPSQPSCNSIPEMGNLATCLAVDRTCDIVVSRGIQCELSRLPIPKGFSMERRPLVHNPPESDSDFSSATESTLWHQSRQHNRNTNAYHPPTYSRITSYKSNCKQAPIKHWVHKSRDPSPSHSQLRELMKRERTESTGNATRAPIKQQIDLTEAEDDEYWNDERKSCRQPSKHQPESLHPDYWHKSTISPKETINCSNKRQTKPFKTEIIKKSVAPSYETVRRTNKRQTKTLKNDYWNDTALVKDFNNRSVKRHGESLEKQCFQNGTWKYYGNSNKNTPRSETFHRQTSQNNCNVQIYSDKLESNLDCSIGSGVEIENIDSCDGDFNEMKNREIEEKRKLYDKFKSAAAELNKSSSLVREFRKCEVEDDLDKVIDESLDTSQRDTTPELKHPELPNINVDDTNCIETLNKTADAYVLFSKGSEEHKRREVTRKYASIPVSSPLQMKTFKGKQEKKPNVSAAQRQRIKMYEENLKKSNNSMTPLTRPASRRRSSNTKPAPTLQPTSRQLHSAVGKIPIIDRNRHPRSSTQEFQCPKVSPLENSTLRTSVPLVDEPVNDYGSQSTLSRQSYQRLLPQTPENELDRDSIWGQASLVKRTTPKLIPASKRPQTPLPKANQYVHRFFLPESAAVEDIIADPNDRRIKAICERLRCDIDIYPKVAHGGFLKNMVVIAAPSEENLRKCARTLDNSLHWCLSSQLT